MPTKLDSSQYEVVSGAAPTQLGGAAPLKKLDATAFEPLPSYANGASPDTPVNDSPVSLGARALMSLGNESGKIASLKQSYEDVSKTKDGDLVVKDNGIWHRVSPDVTDGSDAWDITKRIVGKLADHAGEGLDIGGQIAGSIGGALLGPAGAVAGSGAGAAVGEGFRTSLGRLAGTYQATPEQQAKDIGWEGLLGSGGELVGLGVKPGFKMLRGALSHIGDTATNFAKENLSGLWGTLTGAGQWATRRAMDDAPAVISKADEAVRAIGPKAARVDALDVIANRQANIVKRFAAQGDEAIGKQYRRDLADLVSSTPDSYKADIGSIMNDVKMNLSETGYGELQGAEREVPKFKLFSDEDIAHRMGVPTEQLPKIIGPNTREALEQVTNLVNKYSQFGSLKGKQGAAQVVELRKALNESFDDLLGPEVHAPVKRVVMQVKGVIDQGIGQTFADAGKDELYNKFATMNANFRNNIDSVRMFKDAVENGSTDSLVKKLVSKAGSNRQLKDEAKTVADLLGERGHQSMNDLLDWEAAKGFTSFGPSSYGGNSAITLGKMAGTVVQQTNPRVVGKQIQYGSAASDFVKSLQPKQLKAFLSNDDAMARFMTSLAQAYDGEDQHLQQLVSGANQSTMPSPPPMQGQQ